MGRRTSDGTCAHQQFIQGRLGAAARIKSRWWQFQFFSGCARCPLCVINVKPQLTGSVCQKHSARQEVAQQDLLAIQGPAGKDSPSPRKHRLDPAPARRRHVEIQFPLRPRLLLTALPRPCICVLPSSARDAGSRFASGVSSTRMCREAPAASCHPGQLRPPALCDRGVATASSLFRSFAQGGASKPGECTDAAQLALVHALGGVLQPRPIAAD